MRVRGKQVILRMTEKEQQQIQKKISESKLSQNDYLLKCALDKKIFVVEGVKELTLQVKKIGNNLNQITKAVHEGKADCRQELQEINEEMKEVWQSLRLLIQKEA